MNKTSDVLSKEKFYVYILFSNKDNKFYTGFTTNLQKRLKEHRLETVTSTKMRRPFALIHYEYFINKKDAKMREVFLKSGFGRKQIKQALKRTLSGFK